MNPATRQDLFNAIDRATNNIISRMVTKYDVQQASNQARDRMLASLQALHAENQSMIRASNAGRDQMWRRISAMESQLVALQHEIRAISEALGQTGRVEAGRQITRSTNVPLPRSENIPLPRSTSAQF